jgi:hypothetical protein
MANMKAASSQRSSVISLLSAFSLGAALFLFALGTAGFVLPHPWVDGQGILGGVFGFTLLLAGLGLRFSQTDALDVR